MPANCRIVFPAVVAAALCCGALPARSDELPTRIGACGETTIKFLGGRLEGDTTFETGTAVLYDNGGVQISYDREEGAIMSRVGDPVRLCLVSIPEDCPPGDDRGKVYAATNLRTGATWEMPDSAHMCGGA
ncbi:MAG: hypothetical protein KDJ87_05395 [Rhizobiaceae bacterium]|nr:hypothetical protein [Rhizobiaceae bacterium]